ncbi:cystathionine beta-synthase [Rhodococcus sp. 06-156-3C]|uniref:PLP-dependent cysteine synthase family protein n=1 Tax=Nocardiaceae TaxID=85025 RepID=UPI0005230535|nr:MULTISPECIES: cysteine synthase family protein [Rhodococcus]OZD10828.1 cystathionine beta-synthase [Rhodococcus sp. 06-156-4C]OZD11511.1 cystathionine beta-synthase [Rhodococcus sp. 06-156-3C]OZD13746.1 cystathionine beta-synthase [Rhodococcus sp. 06-156-4a]OZD28107.1 cystathionine beta-synthase [Rhodococcus sp. 06-156-3b]OZD30370.1 cystathionine beta-synthase [Rhodococcus sp. 06-156-3]
MAVVAASTSSASNVMEVDDITDLVADQVITTAPSESVLGLIGNTPLVDLGRLGSSTEATLLGKVEFVNPGGSAKDRIAASMIEHAEREGALTPDSVIIDATSGNTGAGLAMIAAAKGYRTILVVADKVSPEKISVLRAFGAEIVLTSAQYPLGHPRNARTIVTRLVEQVPNAWTSAQYDNPANPAAHFRGTGPELWEQTEGRITHFVANIGTGGTISGTGRYLKEVSDGRVQIIGADPVGSAYSGEVTPYYVEGAGRAMPDGDWPTTYDTDIVDRIIRIDDAASFRSARALARNHGLLVGISSGTVAAATVELARDLRATDTVVSLLIDSGRGYLGKLFDDAWLTERGLPTPADEGYSDVVDVRDEGRELAADLAHLAPTY